jgi:amino acid adenylation domain-containing protein
LEMIVGILGILKAGGAYIPLDPTHPPERLAAILEDAQVSILLTQQQLVENLPEYVGKRVCLDADWDVIAAQKDDNPAYKGILDNLAYVIYTSGSTGKPKGVLVQHVNVIRLFTTTEQWFHFNQNDVWTLFHSVAFDFSVWEIWGALLHGGRLIVVPYIVSRSPEEFYHLLSRSQVTVLNQTPGAFSQLIQVEESNKALPELSLRLVIFGGEALKLPTLKPWFDRHGDRVPQLVNMYGITETTVHVTYHPLTIADLDRTGSIIGRPLPDLQVYLFDRHFQPVPIGIPGEMYISGSGVARGYLQRSDLTAERFITNPFSNKSARLYKSGDLARYLPNGELEYLGRIDQQVKIRGFRIELGEVEAAISQHPQVSQVTVIDAPEERLRQREDIPGNKQLVAYVVTPSGKEVSSTEIRTYLKDKLPNYAIPAVVVCLDRLPLTPNGKVDRVALPAPDMSLSLSEKFVLPHTKTEQVLANIWAEILNIEKIGINDNFFDLGGHSLLATQIVSRIHEALEVKLPLQDLFEQTTIASLAERIDDVSMTLKVFQEQSITSENEEEGTI